ncbi:MAG: hypothetical protein KatS3mg121_0764 [Gammaproteobacteria bacterium]|nr:MAG: hypothetical protein KatS3mg121_0764 [Gammaproteobacteria bacterium]
MRWLGFQWEGEPRYASDYFEQLYEWALYLIRAGKAYVCQLSPEEARAFRGTLTEPGRDSPYRNRSVEEKPGAVRAHAPRRVRARRGRVCAAKIAHGPRRI